MNSIVIDNLLEVVTHVRQKNFFGFVKLARLEVLCYKIMRIEERLSGPL
jgi:hypothetical protein